MRNRSSTSIPKIPQKQEISLTEHRIIETDPTYMNSILHIMSCGMYLEIIEPFAAFGIQNDMALGKLDMSLTLNIEANVVGIDLSIYAHFPYCMWMLKA